MGSTKDSDPNRGDDDGPQHKVTIAQPFAVERAHVIRGEFAAFVRGTGHKLAGGCIIWTGS
jgi:formylglycine-generating enzyme required for sulfatase activity